MVLKDVIPAMVPNRWEQSPVQRGSHPLKGCCKLLWDGLEWLVVPGVPRMTEAEASVSPGPVTLVHSMHC